MDPFRHGQTIHYLCYSIIYILQWLPIHKLLTMPWLIHLSLMLEDSIPWYRTSLTSQLLQQGGINQTNSALHSFRNSTATTTTATGFPAWLIKSLGRWNSDAYLIYIRYPNTVLSAILYMLNSYSADASNQPSWDPDSWKKTSDITLAML